MEIKNLKEQDTGQIYLPRVHADGIIGLDSSSNNSKYVISHDFTDTDHGITRGLLRFVEYNRIVVVNLEMMINVDNTDVGSIYSVLRGNGQYNININNAALKKYSFMVFDTVTFDTDNHVLPYCVTSAAYDSKVLSINCSTQNSVYGYDGANQLYESIEYLKPYKVIGTAIGARLGVS